MGGCYTTICHLIIWWEKGRGHLTHTMSYSPLLGMVVGYPFTTCNCKLLVTSFPYASRDKLPRSEMKLVTSLKPCRFG